MSRVLIAEDDLALGRDLAGAFARAGYEVDGPHASFASASVALAQCLSDDAPVYAVIDVTQGADRAAMLIGDLDNYGIEYILCERRKPETGMRAATRHVRPAPIRFRPQAGARRSAPVPRQTRIS